MKKFENSSNIKELRARAEAFLNESPSCGKKKTSRDAGKLLEDLQIHQVELEMQNEELRLAKLELEAERDKYSAFYDFAPVGYFTLSDKGMILEANLTGAAMLGKERGVLTGNLFSDFISRDDQDIFYQHRRKLVETKNKQTFKLRIVNKDGSQFHVQMECVPVLAENRTAGRFQAVVIDITEQRQIEEALLASERNHRVLTGQLRELSKYLQSSREQERTSIAREIHDDLGQTLVALKMDLSWLGKRLPEGQSLLKAKQESMDEALERERLITVLRPGLLDDLGLIPALHWQVADFQERTGIKCKTHIEPGDVSLDEDRSTAIFRIFQEALTNIARHAKATKVNISFVVKADELLLKIKDNGKGISKDLTFNSKSFGLIGMQERAYVFGGKVEIEGVKGKGTTVKATIPVGTIAGEQTVS